MNHGDPEFTGEILEELVHQFADPVSCFRELVQNAIDAGTSEIDINFRFEPPDRAVEDADERSDKEAPAGAMVMELRDYGSGMDKDIIDDRLTRLFSSEKEGDATKIGKFGIGFVSVFALEPDAVIIDTGRAGEHWRIVFDKDRSFRRFALSQPIEGTKVQLIKAGTLAEFEELRERAKSAVRHWCAHVDVELRFDGDRLNEAFGVEAFFVHQQEAGLQRFVVGHAPVGKEIHGFYNSGITLEAASEVLPEFSGLSFKVLGGDLEHTLTRDAVVRNEAFHHALVGLRKLVDGPVREEMLRELASSIEAGKRGRELVALYGAARIHLRRIWTQLPAPMSEIGPSPLLPRADGSWLTIAQCLKLAHEGPLTFARSACPAAKLFDKDKPVLITDDCPEVAGLIAELSLRGEARDLDKEVALPDFDSKVAKSMEAKRLCAAVQQVLEETGAKVRACCVAHFRWPGSAIAKRVALTILRRDRPPPLSELGDLGHGFFSRERELVLNADHTLIKEALIASQREPEVAAYLVLKAFRLDQEAMSFKHDSERIDAAWNMRCRRLSN